MIIIIIINFILRVTLDSMSTEKLVALDPNIYYNRIYTVYILNLLILIKSTIIIYGLE